MLVKDSISIERTVNGDARAAYADRVNAATMAELGRARLMQDGDLAPNNPARQMGRVMTPRELERLIAGLNVPNLIFETHPTNPNKRCLYQTRGADKHLVCVYENNPMPEFSIVMGVIKWVPDPDYIGDGGKVATRKDLQGAAKPISNERAYAIIKDRGADAFVDEMMKRAEDADTARIGMKEIVVPGAEKVRGWRTVLVYMMQHGLISPEQVRNAGVSDADRASWAGHTGSRPEALGEWLS